MNFLIYLYIFIIGITFGSFFTLAVHRIPKGEDITHTRSYCPKCNHKLGFWDMIPLFSYMFLGGKCRYCKAKIRPRYFMLELLSGVVFVLFGLSINLCIESMNISKLVYYLIGLLYISGLFIIAGIDKEKIKVQPQLLIYLIIVQTIYIIYLCIVENANIYRYVIYLIMLLFLTIFNVYCYKKNLKNLYIIDCLILLINMILFSYEVYSIITIIITFLSISIKLILTKLKVKVKRYVKDNEKKQGIPFAFYLCTSNIITLIISNFIVFYRG